MRLKCIKLAGFKSFVDVTTVNFPSNLCAIVGPNGCGKSNIIDAVRWVMGESSAKHLRGEAMTDVIFNGSGGRKPVAQASIELVFDNSDKTITGEYAAFNEISIRRKVTREAQSFYYLNGTKCRRRDITDIFLGTGLGPRSYSIIEQGMISRLIEAKPDETRIFIEEAAGISKYKERRRDTENRIRRTRENLERLTDIREELERQLQHLKRQAAAAEKYSEFKKEERLLKAQLQALKWRELDGKVKLKEDAIRELEVKVEEQVTQQVHFDAEIEKYRVGHTEQNDQYNEVQGRYYSIGNEIARVEQSIQHNKERVSQLTEDLAQTERSLQETDQQLSHDLEKVEGWQAELLDIEPELELVKAAEEESALALVSAEETMQDWQGRWDEFNEQAAEPQRTADVEQSRIQHHEQSLQRLSDKVEKLEEERKHLTDSDVDDEISGLKEQLAETELQSEEKQNVLNTLYDKIEACREESAHSSDQLDAVRLQLQSNKGRFASLETLQQAALGQATSAISKWLEANELETKPRLAEQLKVEQGWDVAVETVLGSYLQAVCVDGLDSVMQAFAHFDNDGSVAVVDTSSISSTSSTSGATLASKVVSKIDMGGLLASVYVAADLTEAMSRRTSLMAHESIITPEGVWLGCNWLRVAKDTNEQLGVLQRQEELEQLVSTIASQEQQVEELSQQLQARRQQLKQWEQEREQLRKQVSDIEREYSGIRSSLSAKEAQIEQILVRKARTESEIKEIQQQIRSEQESLSQSRIAMSAAIDAMERDTLQKETLLEERDKNRAVLDQVRQRARHDKDRAHELAMRHQSIKTQLDSMQGGVERLRVAKERFGERQTTITEALSATSAPLDEMVQELDVQLEQRVRVEEELTEARCKVQEIEHSLRETEHQRTAIDQTLQALRGNLEGERLATQEIQVRRKTLQEQLAESEYDLETVLNELPEEASETKWEEQLTSIGNRIQRLGAINLAAIDEYKAAEERKTYLDTQNDDLEGALETLEGAILKIDRETRIRFKETFDYINSQLQALFPKLFGGGNAYLELTGEDLLDTGVTIMARPPGKRNSTIHLLSGGEKALTAIALVFSIFSLNPAPFCMLDEVDAPLDDANVGRYARLVAEMSDKVQFILITHNKIAMEMAKQLLGVTMHERGVSRLVAVDVEEAAELAAV